MSKRALSSTALLVIDVQQGLCEGDHAAFEYPQIIERINRVSLLMRSKGAPVCFVQHDTADGDPWFDSREWQLADGLNVDDADQRVRKSTPDAFNETGLQKILQDAGVNALVVMGMHTEFCVDTTTRRALALGYPVILLEDGHTSEGHQYLSAPLVIQHHNHTLANITSFASRVQLMSVDEYCHSISASD